MAGGQMPRAARNILETVGNTPLLQLERAFSDWPFTVFAKVEAFNPGGSIKDRPARAILLNAMNSGQIDHDTIVVESSSGNMGIGLAQACKYLGLRFVCVIDAKTTSQNQNLLRTYGATLSIIDKPDPESGEYLTARLRRVKELLDTYPKTFWPNQYANPRNAAAHHDTMAEIMNCLDGDLDFLFCSTSTCGTLRGCSEYLKQQGFPTRVIAVDAIGSVIFGGKVTKRVIPGHGAARCPELFRTDLAERCIHMSDWDCVIGCRRLLEKEALLVGGSSGASLMAIEKMAHEIPSGARCAVIFPDGGQRYLDTIFSDTWVLNQFGELPVVNDEEGITCHSTISS